MPVFGVKMVLKASSAPEISGCGAHPDDTWTVMGFLSHFASVFGLNQLAVSAAVAEVIGAYGSGFPGGTASARADSPGTPASMPAAVVAASALPVLVRK